MPHGYGQWSKDGLWEQGMGEMDEGKGEKIGTILNRTNKNLKIIFKRIGNKICKQSKEMTIKILF